MKTKLSNPVVKFSDWLHKTREALFSGSPRDVACGDCIGCCTSHYNIHIDPEEKTTLNAIPKKYWIPAPNRPEGCIVLGYFTNGACPMLVDNKCSIYECRPITCQRYDCRIAAAAGMRVDGEERYLINESIQSWQFVHPTDQDRKEQEAVKKAATFLQENEQCFPPEYHFIDNMQIATAAITIYKVFLAGGKGDNSKKIYSNEEIAQAIIAERSLYTIP
jgi:uncharacterized protein